MLCRLKRYDLIHHESRDERGILRFPLAISMKYVFSEATEGFVETEEKLTPNKFFRVHAKRSSPGGSTYSKVAFGFCSLLAFIMHLHVGTFVIYY